MEYKKTYNIPRTGHEAIGEISKPELEALFGNSITDSIFEEAVNSARCKQAYIYQHSKREEVLQRWYLLELIKEYVKSITFSRFTMDLCREVCKTKEECL